jgi:hypothetical protein
MRWGWGFGVLLAGFSLVGAAHAQQADIGLRPAVMAPIASGNETVAAAASESVVPAPMGFQWRILKTKWTASDERAYGEFITAIGKSNCRTVDQCLRGPANVYRHSDPKGLTFFADCADLAYVLRAYFAWKNSLPFSYASIVTPLGYSRDFRYSRHGNAVYARRDITTPQAGVYPSIRVVLQTMLDTISTAMYRVPPVTTKGQLPDFYPVKLAPGSVRPGTVIYDPNGHAAVIYDVDKEGRIRFIDSHPDNSVSRGNYGERFVRASPPMGAGFKNWRPAELIGAVQAGDGSFVGGRIKLAADSELADWSDEQFYGNATPRAANWSAAAFVFKGQTLNYYDYVRRAVAGHDIVYDPIVETRSMVKGLCDDLTYRAQAVDIAITANVHLRPQPDRLPENIYGTSGDWETYSTPSRDARLKVSFKELLDQVIRFVDMVEKRSKDVSYKGSSIRKDIEKAYLAESAQCAIVYKASNGQAWKIPYEEARRRLTDMSFDPHHCPERRWGARMPAEMSSCPDGALKTAWYKAQQRLRNQSDRTYDAKMDFTLRDLQNHAPGSGWDAPQDTDVLGFLRGVKPVAASERQ